MTNEDKILKLFKERKIEKEIAFILQITKNRVSQVLQKNGLKEKNNNYLPKIYGRTKDSIVEFAHKGLTPTEIAKIVRISASGIRIFLSKNELPINVKKIDTSRPCVVCNNLFTPSHSDGVKKDKYKTCSKSCLHIRLSKVKTKYTNEEINRAIDLKRMAFTNHIIEKETDVNINKIKEIVREKKLFLSKEQAQRNAYESKLEKNPHAIEEMRNVYGLLVRSEEALEKLKKTVKERGFEYIDGFETKTKPFKIKCLNCNKIRETSTINTVIKNSCIYCSEHGTSKPEQELLAWVREYYPEADKFYFPKISNKGRAKEIDIYIPELKLGIEFCGLYFHTEQLAKDQADQNKHYKKMLLAANEGIRLITIFENEWKNSKNQIKGFLKSVLHKNNEIVYGRKCLTTPLDNREANEFLKNHHIQGKVSGNGIFFGLKYKEELVAVINGGTHPRKNVEDGALYLNRLAFKNDVSVIGGSSKLFKALYYYAKSNGYSKIISWSDNRWSEGNVYKKLGFQFDSQKSKGRGLKDGSIWPEFYYVVNGELYTRREIKKLQTKGEFCSKIYDCGKKRWVYCVI